MTYRVDHDEILRLHREGMSAPQIADMVGCSTRLVSRVRRANGLSSPAPDTAGRPVTPERLEAARRLLEDGASRSEVVRTLGMHWRTVARYFPESGWSAQESGRFAAVLRKWGRP